jgi:hypothetical protein
MTRSKAKPRRVREAGRFLASARPGSGKKFASGEHIERQRRRLLGADAVVVCVQRALDSRQAPPDEIRVGDALQVASDIINDAVEALELMTG